MDVVALWGSKNSFIMDLSLAEKRILWVVGAMERLGGLGYFKEVGYKVDKDCVDLYLELDEIRDYLFEEDEEIFFIVMSLIEESDLPMEEIKEIYNLVISYKNDRKKVFVYAMNNFSLV